MLIVYVFLETLFKRYFSLVSQVKCPIQGRISSVHRPHGHQTWSMVFPGWMRSSVSSNNVLTKMPEVRSLC